MIGVRVAAAASGLVLIATGAARCDSPPEAARTGIEPAAVVPNIPTISPNIPTISPNIPTTVTSSPTSSRTASTTSLTTTSTTPSTTVAATTSTSTSTTTLPETGDDVTLRQHAMYERSGDVLQLQIVLGLRPADGIYGPNTRSAHMAYLGGPAQAVGIFYPEFAQAIPVSDSPALTLGGLVDRYFHTAADQEWALRAALCESSALPSHVGSAEVSSALAVGWFQHLARFWAERSTAAGWEGSNIFDPEANVAVAAWLYYTSGPHHWNPSRTCWEEQ